MSTSVTVVPCSPPCGQSEENVRFMINDIISKIRIGISELGTTDIENLEDAMVNFPHKFPFLDRTFLSKTSANDHPTMVRYIGMVQDMLDPEYYNRQINGVHMKYRDSSWSNYDMNVVAEDDDLDLPHNLAERQPLLLVPIPFANSWLNDTISSDTRSNDQCHQNDDAYMKENLAPQINRNKRPRSTTNDSTDDEDDSITQSRNVPNIRHKPEEEFGSSNKCQSIDWWPQGCMGSDELQHPILAKMYYNECDNTYSRLKLNDVVEVVGILSMDPTEAEFNHQDPLEKEFLPGFDHEMVLPPPSILPRVHVLCFKKRTLDQFCNHQPKDNFLNEVDDRTTTIQTFSRHIFDDNVTASENLLLALLSMAERENISDKPITTPHGITLGCTSLNFILPDSLSCNIVYHRLVNILKKVTPVTAVIDLQNDFSNPTKNECGHLEPSVMQLPRGSCIIINQGSLNSSSFVNDKKDSLNSLAKLIRYHKVPYIFDGMMDIDFECDVRVIVLSCPSKEGSSRTYRNDLLSCSINSVVDSKVSELKVPDDLPSHNVDAIRNYLAHCRGFGHGSKVTLPREVLVRAQNYFVEKRKDARMKSKEEISEDDLHRWLSLTRLLARSRLGLCHVTQDYSITANIEDWDRAIDNDTRSRPSSS